MHNANYFEIETIVLNGMNSAVRRHKLWVLIPKNSKSVTVRK